MNFLKKKKKGTTILGGIYQIIFVMVVAIMFTVFLESMKSVDTVDNINQILNRYQLCLESDGYLSDVNVASLEQELTEAGMHDIDVRTGTNLQTNPASYGDPVQLHVTGKITTKNIEMTGLFTVSKADEERVIDEVRKTTSHGMS